MGDRIEFQDIPFNKNVPQAIKDIVATWDEIYKSPYSLSLYDTDGKSWDHTPEGSLRVSDHWNFEAGVIETRIHCPTRGERPKKGWWTVARWEDGAYTVLSSFYPVNTRKDRRAARKLKESELEG